MDNDVYKCRLCLRMYHDKGAIIDLSSEEAKNEQITHKILSALSILITDLDPTPKYICRVCNGQVDVIFRFATTCRINNLKHMENVTNDMLKTEYKKFMRLPVHFLFNKYQFDVKGLFDTVTSYLSDNNEDLSSTQNFDQNIGLNNHNSITNQLNIENDNPVGNGIPEISPVLEVNEPQINPNNVNHTAETGINKNVQINKQFPIGCRNNVTKRMRYPILSKPLPLLKINNISGGTNIVQNLSAAARKNQSTVNSLTIDKNTINNHSYSVLSKVNGTTTDNEVICLDDDDDEDNNNNDNQEVRLNQEILLNEWLKPDHTQANSSTHKTYQRTNKKKTIKIIPVKRKIISLSDNVQSTNTVHSLNIPCEEMTITPDLGFSTSNLGSSLNGEEEYFEALPQINNVSTVPSRVLPDTGFHFLFKPNETVDLTKDLTKKKDNAAETTVVLTKKKDNAAETTVVLTKKKDNAAETTVVLTKKKDNAAETTVVLTKKKDNAAETTVDLTNKEDNSPPKKKSSGRKRKNLDTKKSVVPKKQALKTSIIQHNQKAKIQLPTPVADTQIIERSNTSLIKPRPKRASAAVASSSEIKNMHKLGKHVEGTSSYWYVRVTRFETALYTCPICNLISTSTKSRQRHEISKHSSLLSSVHKPAVNSAPSTTNAASTQQLYLFNYLQLCLVKKDEPGIINQLAKRHHLLKALKILGPKTFGSFKCNYCRYETNLMFVLWAHMSSNHLKCNVEKKSSLHCFLCSRTVSKRTTLLKHVEKCSKETSDTISSSNQFTCVHCSVVFDSLIKLEDHTWKHK
ncbi:bromodomain-containing protein DDB_G0270170-like isoform X1 [Aphis gossypii]|uniref:bromodomain-containing protein DDB_G0270170-like isoform X1 n=1 Tax=Aphis gossypii TaxID=80765 RepID=UPI0021590E6F|nr:bromodomain-containing protein DDB_G0270170-like isoform X1 [Aphis gossypii]